MRRIFNWDKKYLYWGVTAFCVIACSILFYMALQNYKQTILKRSTFSIKRHDYFHYANFQSIQRIRRSQLAPPDS